MFEAYVAKYLKTKWALVTNIGTIVPGDLHYGRKTGAGTPYARFTLSTQKIQHISDGVRHAHYSIQLEVYSENTSEADLLAIGAALDIQTSATSSLLAVLLAGVGSAISSGGGAPGGTLMYAWRTTPPSSETLQTDEERRSGRDTHVTKWAAKLGVQWG